MFCRIVGQGPMDVVPYRGRRVSAESVCVPYRTLLYPATYSWYSQAGRPGASTVAKRGAPCDARSH
eukprot:1801440-Prymnesium_polylepis.1